MSQPINHNILLLGETGSGKSTLINYLANYFLGGSLDDLKIAIPMKYHPQNKPGFPIHSEQDISDKTKSKTEKCTLYNFMHNGKQYGFIDVPGLSDTNGADKDIEHIENIMTTAENIGSIAAIVLVINGTVSRVTANLKNAIDRMRCAVPDVLLSNLVVVFTNCSEDTVNFELFVLKPLTIPEKNIFYMDNNALRVAKKDWNNNQEKKERLKSQWKTSMEVIEQMMEQIDQFGSMASNAFGEMHELGNLITIQLNECRMLIEKLQTTQKQYDDSSKALNEATAGIKATSNYSKKVTKEELVLIHTPYWNIVCRNCNPDGECCHDCKAIAVKFCSKFHNYQCTKCKCSLDFHYFETYKPRKNRKVVIEINEFMKQQHDNHVQAKARIEVELPKLSAKIDSLKQSFDTQIQKIQNCCQSLRKIRSQSNFTAEQADVFVAILKDVRNMATTAGTSEARIRLNYVESLTEFIQQP
ncbi:uncharacterized protein LOC134289771 [Aedes albopictus]|uniref:AIG1-type G domain-containing protein n=1 Tax=Aedes albopictus TaxID=7160 RepID=A0ABM1YA87_AEDAL